MAFDQLDNFDYNPEEEQAKAVDKSINSLLASYDNVAPDVRNPGLYLQYAKQLGLSTDRYAGYNASVDYEYGGDVGAVYRIGPGHGSKLADVLHDGNDQVEAQKAFSDMVQTRQKQLQQQKLDLLNQGKERRIARATDKENKLTASVDGFRSEMDSAIDKYMSTQLEEIGFRADTARQQTAGSFANRGLLRSSLAGERINDVTLEELGQKGQTRGAADAQKVAVDSGVQDVKDQITRQRERLKVDNQLSEISAAENIIYQFDENSVRDTINQRILQLELDAESQSFFTKLIGSTIGQAGKLIATVASGGAGK